MTVSKPSALCESATTPSLEAIDRQITDADATAGAVPFNVGKADEYDPACMKNPGAGPQNKPASYSSTASTLTENNLSKKTGQASTPGEGRSAVLTPLRTDASGQALTTNQGVPIGNNQDSLKAGLRGPALLKDFILREKITHFDHERIPERIVHARGSAAHGIFESYGALDSVTRASLFAAAGKQTPVFVRFSTVAGERGSKDTARDARGFAVKFYTDEGNWDLVGNNMPVFFIQDAMKFPDLVHAVKPEPHNGMPQAASAHDTFWDFVSLMPESTHMLMWLMSDRAIPRSYRMMQGFGVHTFRLVNAEGVSKFVKFHWTPMQGTHSLVWDEAVKISGCDPDYHRRDLWDAIEAGAYPEWELGAQIFSEEQAEGFSFDVLDATKLIPEELVPITALGKMVLNRNPDNFFAETEQVAFCAAHVVPGIDFSNDPLLAGRIHSYMDTQISRLGGPNFHEIPINAALSPVHNNQRDGIHRQAIHRGRVAYEPNSLAGGCPFQTGAAGFVPFPEAVKGDEVRGKPEKFAEHFNQARLFYASQTRTEQLHIQAAYRFELSKVQVPAIRLRVVSMLRNVSQELAQAVAAGLGIIDLPPVMPPVLAHAPVAEIEKSSTLSLFARPGSVGVQTRRVAIWVADGVDGKQAKSIFTSLRAQGANPRMVGPRIGAFLSADGLEIEAVASLETEPSVLFDGLVCPSGNSVFINTFTRDERAVEFIKDQYRHCKTIMLVGKSAAVLGNLGLSESKSDQTGITVAAKLGTNELTQFTKALALHRHFNRESDPPLR